MRKKILKRCFSIFLIMLLVLQGLPMSIQAEEEEDQGKATFTDVAKGKEEINQLVELGVIKGYSDNTFRPYESITRGQGVSMIIREMKLNTSNRPDPEFSDMKSGQTFYQDIATAVDEGIIDGYSDKTFRSNEKMTRSQMARILVDAYDLKLIESKSKTFKDVPATYWAYDYINILASNGITVGYSDGTFNPTGNLTRLDFSRFLARYINEVKNESKDKDITELKKQFELKADETKISSGQSVSLSLEATGKEELAYKTDWKATGGKLTVAKDGKSAKWQVEDNATKDYTVTVTIETALKSGKKITFDKTVTLSVTSSGGSSSSGGSGGGSSEDDDESNPKNSPGRVLVSGDNKVTLLASTIFIDEETASNIVINSDASQVIFAQPIALKPGDVFLIPEIEDYPGGLALKTVSVMPKEGKTIVETSEPKMDEVFHSIKGKIDTEFKPEDFEPAEGVTVENSVVASSLNKINILNRTPLIASESLTENFRYSSLSAPVTLNADNQRMTAAALEGSIKLNLDDEFNDDGPIKLNGTVELSGKFTGEVDWAMEPDLVDSIDMLFEGKQTFKGEVVAQVDNEDRPIKRKIGTLTIRTQIPGLTLRVPAYAVVRAEGKFGVEFVAGFEQELGFKYDDHNGGRIYPEDNFRGDFDISDPTGSFKASVGVELPFEVRMAGWNIVVYDQEPGVEGEVKTSVVGVNGLFSCTKVDFGIYYDASVVVPIIDWESRDITGQIKLPSPAPFGNCVRYITVAPDELEMAPGEVKSFLVKAHDGFNGSDNIAIDEDVSFASSVPDIIKVRKHQGTDGDTGGAAAEVIVADNAQDGDHATITVTYKVGDDKYEEILNVKVVDQRERGTLVGKVVDAIASSPLEEASVKIYNGDRLVQELSTETNGSYETSLVPATYRVVVEYPGYIKETSNITVTEANTVTYDAKLQLVGEQYAGIGTVAGAITNALTGQPAPEMTLEIRRGRNSTDGDIVKTVKTNESGQYQLELPGGNYTAQVSGEGYVTTFFIIVSVGDHTRENQNATISPEGLLGESIRVVLNWGATPSDLDSHLTGPTADGSRFHVYYSIKDYEDSQNDINLDVDQTNSYGPETVTIIERLNEGTYVYGIHNYSARDLLSNNYGLSNSEATVRIYSGNALLATFNVPIDKEGNVWRVFEIRDGVIVPINKMDYISGWNDASYFAPEAEQGSESETNQEPESVIESDAA